MPRRASLAIVLLAATLTGAACRTSTDPVADQGVLPTSLAVRSDTPYIAGVIADRQTENRTMPRILVQASGASRMDRAWVTVHPDSLLVRRDGKKASAADLTVGRPVVVWVNGPELRSYPVQVTGSAILVER